MSLTDSHPANASTGSDRGRAVVAGIGMLGAVLIVSLVIGWLTPGYEGDIHQNKDWARHLVRNGMHAAYRANIDYPPIPLYTFAGAGWVYQQAVDPRFNEDMARESLFFTFLMKVPVIACHVALTGLLFWLAVGRGVRFASLVAAAYGLNPAMLYDIAHFGQTDSLLGLAVVGAIAALQHGALALFGVGAAVLLFTKPQGWPLLPVLGVMLLRARGLMGVIRPAIGALMVTVVVLSPWLVTNRLGDLGRFAQNLEAHDISNRVISADAHNLWWIPTLLNWDWVEDSTPLLGPLSYRTVATVLALTWLGLCCWAAWRRSADPYVIAAATSFGFFMLMVRAHENHAYLAVALLIGSIAARPRPDLWAIYWLGSLGFLMNLVLRDPLVMGPFTSVPDPGQDAPLVAAIQVANVLVNAVVLAALAGLLVRDVRGSRAESSA